MANPVQQGTLHVRVLSSDWSGRGNRGIVGRVRGASRSIGNGRRLSPCSRASAAWELEDWFVETIEQHRSKDS
jgi:hypothetical protein